MTFTSGPQTRQATSNKYGTLAREGFAKQVSFAPAKRQPAPRTPALG